MKATQQKYIVKAGELKERSQWEFVSDTAEMREISFV